MEKTFAKKKIYIVSWYGCSNVGGVERVVQYMKESWDSDYQVDVIDFEKLKNIPVYRAFLGIYYEIDSILMSIYVNRMRRSSLEKCIIVTNGYNCPFVHTDLLFSHGTMRGFKLACEKSRIHLWQISQIYEKIAHKKAKRIICVSQNAALEAQQYYGAGAEKIEVLENCVNTDIFFPDRTLRKKNDTINIIFCGTLEYRKGVDTLLKYAELIEQQKDMRLLIATQRDKNTALFSALKHTKIFRNLPMESLNSFYNQGDIMLFPSRYEGFEMVTTECLAAGTPVIGNNIGAVGHIYHKDLEGAFLLKKSEEKNMKYMREIALDYRDFNKKKTLHENMKRYFGLQQYQERLKNIIQKI